MNFGWNVWRMKNKSIKNVCARKTWPENQSNTYVMTQIGIHNNDKITVGMLDAMNVCSSQTQFWCSWTQQNFIFTVNQLQLFGNIQCSVRTTIVDDNYFKVEFTVEQKQIQLRGNWPILLPRIENWIGCRIPFIHVFDDQPYYNW